MGQVRRKQTRGGIRTQTSMTAAAALTPRQAAAGPPGHDQAAGQAAPASPQAQHHPRPGTPAPALGGTLSDEQLLAQNIPFCEATEENPAAAAFVHIRRIFSASLPAVYGSCPSLAIELT